MYAIKSTNKFDKLQHLKSYQWLRFFVTIWSNVSGWKIPFTTIHLSLCKESQIISKLLISFMLFSAIALKEFIITRSIPR